MTETNDKLEALRLKGRQLETQRTELEARRRHQVQLEEDVFASLQETLYYLDQSLEQTHSSVAYTQTSELMSSFQGESRQLEGFFEEGREQMRREDDRLLADLDEVDTQMRREIAKREELAKKAKEVKDGQS